MIHRRTRLAPLAASALALGLAGAVLAPSVALAAPVVSQSNGRLVDIDGAVSGLTDIVVELEGAQATNTDASGAKVVNQPLDAQALSTLTLTSTGTNVLGDNGIVRLGAVGQYSVANDDGSSTAYAGGVSSADSLIGVDSVTPGNVGSPEGNASIVLSTSTILGGSADLVDLEVNVGVLAASAEQTPEGEQSGQSIVSDVTVVVGGDVLEPTVQSLRSALATVITAAGLTGLNLPNPLRADGTIVLTEEELLAAAGVASINDLPANTDLLTFVPGAVVTKLTKDVNTVLDAVQKQVEALGLAGTVLNLALNTARGIVDPILDGLTETVEGPLSAAIDPLAALVVNGKSTSSDGAFSQTALSLQLGSTPSGEALARDSQDVAAQVEPLAEVPNGRLAAIDLADATVGPNAGEAAVPIASAESLAVGGLAMLMGVAGYAVLRHRRLEQSSVTQRGTGS